MTQFRTHTRETAPAEARPVFDKAEQGLGFVPNLIGRMAEAPALAEAYLTLNQLFEQTSFAKSEQQLILLTVSRYNECHYCVAAHSAAAESAELDPSVIDAVREDRSIPDARLEALRQFTTVVVDKRGWVAEEEVNTFLDAGFEPRQVLEVILGVGMKTLSNYTNHVAQTPLDQLLGAWAWTPRQAR